MRGVGKQYLLSTQLEIPVWNLVKALILNELVNPTSNHQDIISVIFPLIWPEIVLYRGLRAKKEQEFQRKLTMYIAVVNLRIIHQGRVTKILFPCISVTTSTFIPATHVAEDRGVARLTLMVAHTFYNTTYLLQYLMACWFIRAFIYWCFKKCKV